MLIEYAIVSHVLMGLLGGVAYILIAKVWETPGGKVEVARRLGLGGIAGFLTYLSGLPNHLTAFGLGYFAIDAIEGVVARVKRTSTPTPPPA